MKKTGTSSPKAEKAVGTKKTAAKRVSAAAKTGTAKKAQKAAPAAEEKIPEGMARSDVGGEPFSVFVSDLDQYLQETGRPSDCQGWAEGCLLRSLGTQRCRRKPDRKL